MNNKTAPNPMTNFDPNVVSVVPVVLAVSPPVVAAPVEDDVVAETHSLAGKTNVFEQVLSAI